MGRSGTYNYQAQVDDTKEGRLYLYEAQTQREAYVWIIVEAYRVGASTGYIWPQTATAKRSLRCQYIRVDLFPAYKETRVWPAPSKGAAKE